MVVLIARCEVRNTLEILHGIKERLLLVCWDYEYRTCTVVSVTI